MYKHLSSHPPLYEAHSLIGTQFRPNSWKPCEHLHLVRLSKSFLLILSAYVRLSSLKKALGSEQLQEAKSGPSCVQISSQPPFRVSQGLRSAKVGKELQGWKETSRWVEEKKAKNEDTTEKYQAYLYNCAR